MTSVFQRVLWAAALMACVAALSTPRHLVARGWEFAFEAPEEQKEEGSTRELVFKVINFVILVGGLGYVLRKPAAEFFRSRSAGIQKSLEEGRKALEASEAQLRAVEEKLQHLQDEIAAFKATAAQEMEAERKRLHEAAAEEAARILDSARAQMDAALRAAKLELKNHAAQHAVDLAGDLIRQRLDEPARSRLVKEFAATLHQ